MSEMRDVPIRFATRDEACKCAVNMIRSHMIILHGAGYINTHDWDLMETVLKRDRKLPPELSIWQGRGMTDDEIEQIENKMSTNAEVLMLYFDKMKRRHNIGFHGVVYRSRINGRNYAVEVKLDKDEEEEE